MTETTMTVAEAMQELKRIKKLLPQRYANVARYCSKRKGSRDEVEKQEEYVKDQAQSARDLLSRYRDIKVAIQRNNLEAQIVYEGKIYTIADALMHKQMLFAELQQLLNSFNTNNASLQIRTYGSEFGHGLTNLPPEKLAAMDMIPETYYDEKTVQEGRDNLVGFMTMIDALIDRSNHANTITI